MKMSEIKVDYAIWYIKIYILVSSIIFIIGLSILQAYSIIQWWFVGLMFSEHLLGSGDAKMIIDVGVTGGQG